MESTAAEYIRPLQRLSRQDEPRFGGKSANLGELLRAEIPVPPGFAISTAAFEAFVRDAGLQDRIRSALAGVTPGDVDAIGHASHSISEAMRFAPVPDVVRVEIEQHYASIELSAAPDGGALVGHAAGEDSPPVAVRSSAVGEDSQDATFAGQQETYLWVRGVEHVCDAVRDCWVSLYSPPAISYRLRLGESTRPPAMGVTVQLMVDAEISGVMFTCNPVSGDPSMVAINASWGLGLAVVGGEVTPDDFLVSKVTGEVVREHVHAKQVQYVPDASGSGAVRVAVAPDRQDTRCLDPAALERLVAVARRVERYFGCHQDIEWAIARGEAEALFVVQARPVTAVPKKRDKPKAESALSLIMSTFGAGPPKD
jgi:pyruvate, water dikinase